MDIIKRGIYNQIKNHLSEREITIIIGPRQVGKTTLMHLLEKELKIKERYTIFFDLDRESDSRYFKTQEFFLKKLKLELGDRAGYVFIDEFQRKEDASLFLKGIYDMNLPYKFIISGSGSLELKERVHESLVGRKRVFEVTPVSFLEFIDYKTEYRYSNNMDSFFYIERGKAQILLEEYLNYGGYPRVVLEEEDKEKRRVIDDIFRSYIERDISYLLKVERIDAFSELIRLLSHQIGLITNYSALCANLNISIQTLKNYLYYAEKTFIVSRLTPFFRNARKEIVKSPIFYFYDLGLRNYSIASFGNLYEYGLVFENLVFNLLRELIRFTGVTIHFWRTKTKSEVDFVLKFGEEVLPIEVKYKNFRSPKVERALRSFVEKYNPQKAIVVNLNLRDYLNIGTTRVEFLPIWDFILVDSIETLIR